MPMECALFYSNGIKGSNTKGGREDSSAVIEFNHEVYRPVDPQKGVVQGTRVHKAIDLIMELDTAVPSLYKSCCKDEQLDELVVKWYDTKDQLYFTHTLKKATVASVEVILPNTKDPSKERSPHLVRMRLQYEEIEWNHVGGKGLQYPDAWKKAA